MRKIIFHSLSIILFKKYSSMVDLFVHRFDTYSFDRISYERKDFRQDLLITIYTSILKFLDKMILGKEKNFLNLKKYLFICLKNRSLDTLRKMVTRQQVSIVEYTDIRKDLLFNLYDSGFKNVDLDFSFQSYYYKDIDVFSFLEKKERVVFRRYILNYTSKEISKKFSLSDSATKKIISDSKIKIRKGLIKKYGKDIIK